MSYAKLIKAIEKIIKQLSVNNNVIWGQKSLPKARRIISAQMTIRSDCQKFILGNPKCPLTDFDISVYIELPKNIIKIISDYYHCGEKVGEYYTLSRNVIHKSAIRDYCTDRYKCPICNPYKSTRGVVTLSLVDTISDSELRAMIRGV